MPRPHSTSLSLPSNRLRTSPLEELARAARWLWRWVLRASAVHFMVTAVTGVLLYARPGQGQAGAYSHQVKEWLVMLHNGEWVTHVLMGQRYWSGAAVGVVLSALLFRHAYSRLFASGPPRRG